MQRYQTPRAGGAARRPLRLRPWLTTLLGGLCVVGLTGFARIEMAVRVNEDLSGEQEMLIALDRDAYDSILREEGIDPLQELAKMNRLENTTVTFIENEREVGVRAIQTLEHVHLRWEEGNLNGRLKSTDAWLWEDYELDLTVDLRELAQLPGEASYRFTVQLPVRIEKTNGQLGPDGRSVTWDLEPGRHHLTLQSRRYAWGSILRVTSMLLILLGGMANYVARRQEEGRRQEVQA